MPMAKVEIEINFRLKPEQAAALLEFLSCVLHADIMRALDSPEQRQRAAIQARMSPRVRASAVAVTARRGKSRPAGRACGIRGGSRDPTG